MEANLFTLYKLEKQFGCVYNLNTNIIGGSIMRMTLQQCIFNISIITKKLQKLNYSIGAKSDIPLSVNGEDITNKDKAEEFLLSLKTMEILQEDLIKLKSALNKANNDNKLDGESIFTNLEKVRLKREFLATLENALGGERTAIEEGVGVVEYGVLNKTYIKEKISVLEKEVNTLSEKLDSINGSIEIEVELRGEY